MQYSGYLSQPPTTGRICFHWDMNTELMIGVWKESTEKTWKNYPKLTKEDLWLILKLNSYKKLSLIHTVMFFKADFEGLHYPFLKWKSFYTNLKSIIKIALQKLKQMENPGIQWHLNRSQNRRWCRTATVNDVPASTMKSDTADVTATTQDSSWWNAFWIPDIEDSWEWGNNFLLSSVHTAHHNEVLIQTGTTSQSFLLIE